MLECENFMPAVGRARGQRRVRARAIGRPRGGVALVGGVPKTHVRKEGDEMVYYKSNKRHRRDLVKDRRIRAEHHGSTMRGKVSWRRDAPGSNV